MESSERIITKDKKIINVLCDSGYPGKYIMGYYNSEQDANRDLKKFNKWDERMIADELEIPIGEARQAKFYVSSVQLAGKHSEN